MARWAELTTKGSSSKLLYGAGVLAGIFALAELVLVLIPKFQPLVELLMLLELYLEKINPALIGLAKSRTAQLQLALLFLWVTSIIALEAFSRKKDGLSLWRNILHDSCALVPRGFHRTICATSKWALTVLVAPLLILWGLAKCVASKTSAVTVGFVTVDPVALVGYVKHIVLGLAALASLTMLLLGAVAGP